MLIRRSLLFAAAALLAEWSPAAAQSAYTTRPDDAAAVYVTADFGVRGDGASDDSAGLQAAIDKAAGSFAGGIVFLPSGRYRVTRTIYVWSGVRVIGYGPTRPVLTLPENTPGYQKGIGLMVLFSAGRPAAAGRGGGGRGRVPFPPPGTVPPNENVTDANQVTFYSSMMNVDFEIGSGNPAAVAIRFHVAQHGILKHMDFHVGSGLAALTEIGNVAQDIRVYGGRYGILTTNTSPFWPFTLIDSVFDGQRDAAIREHMAGLTVVRDTFRNVPVALEIDREYSDELWIKDSRFEKVSQAAILISNEKNPMTQVGVENALCSNVPVFAKLRDSGKTFAAPGPLYRVRQYSHGMIIASEGIPEIAFVALRAAPEPLAAAIRPLPPSDTWINVHTRGVKGDGQTDDTEAIRKSRRRESRSVLSERIVPGPRHDCAQA